MADIDIIIRIPEEMYKWVNDANKFSNDYGTGDFIDLIKNGTPQEKESATVAKFHDFYPEDSATWPPADKEILIQSHVGDNFSNYIAYLEYDDGEDGGWGFYSEDGEFILDVTEVDAWMPIPQHERDKNYIPVWERKAKTPIHLFNNDVPSPEEEKDR